jgi:glycoprotein-N-acetylgalactosamine 3-beta-galactosyltransferase
MTGSDEYAKGTKRNIWEKSWRSWVYMLEKHIDDAEFFMKCDSDTFVAVENMKTYLSYFDPEKEWYFGHTLLHEWESNVIFNTGIGYVLSRGTAKRLLPLLKAMTSTCPYPRSCCQMPGPNEDAHMGVCLMDLNILPTNTFDDEGRLRFLSFRPEDHVNIYREDTWCIHSPPAACFLLPCVCCLPLLPRRGPWKTSCRKAL